jgi:hypothetical protein
MTYGKTIFRGAALSLLAVGALLAHTSGPALAGPPEATEVPGLRQAPQIPVSPLIHILPGHAPVQRPDLAPPPDPAREPGGGGCDKDIDVDGQIRNARTVATQDNIICSSADIDVYVRGANTFVVQGGADEAAWTHSDVTDPANPVLVGQFVWSGSAGRGTSTPDIKAFPQGSNDYIALALERTKVNGACGVVIVNVDDPVNPVIESQFIGSDWCDTHNVFVEKDINGDGAYVFATADVPADLRVLDISNLGTVSAPVEVGTYRRTNRNAPTDANVFDDVYVHDVTVIDETVYASYWLAGLDIFDATLIRTPGLTGQFADENTAGVQNIKPADFPSGPPFLVHHAFPNASGTLAFVEDEITFAAGDEPVQMFNVGTGLKVDGLVVDDALGDVPEIPAHNLETTGLTPDRLYVGWYKAGLQAWNFDGLGFTSSFAAPRTAEVFHQAQTEAADDDYSGAWGVRLAEILATPEAGGPDVLSIFAFQSDRSFGLIVNCLGDGNGVLVDCPAAVGGGVPPPTGTGTVKGTVTNSAGTKLGGILVTTDAPSNSDTTNNGGKYSIAGVPTDTVSMVAACPGGDQVEPVTVIADATVTVDFNDCD